MYYIDTQPEDPHHHFSPTAGEGDLPEAPEPDEDALEKEEEAEKEATEDDGEGDEGTDPEEPPPDV